MRRARHTVIATAAAGALIAVSACERAAAPDEAPVEPVASEAAATLVPAVAYACESGGTVSVRYPDTETAEVTYNGQTHPMRVVISASGARYAGSELEWWTANRDGQEGATLSRLGPNSDVGVAVLERCSRPSGSDPLPTPPAPTSQPINGVPACVGPNLRLAREGGDAGAGNRVLVMSLTNIASTPCYLNGYPKVTLFNAQGAALSQVASLDTPSSYFRADQQPVAITLQPQARGYFDIAYSAIPNEAIGETTCPSATRIRVTAPGDTAGVSTELAIEPCGRRLRVSPVRQVAEPEPPAPSAAT
jgi:membrane-bound inhibitor of C-type lysozyme